MARKTYDELQARVDQLELLEASLREAEWKFEALFENGPIGVAYHRMIYDDDGTPVDYYFIDANANYLAMTGVDPRGKRVTEAFPGIESDPFDWIGMFGRVARKGETIRIQQHFELNDRWYDLVGYQYRPDHFVAAFLDITDRMRAEQQLRLSEERYRTLFERSGDAIFVVSNENGRILDANEAAQRLTGRSLDELTGLTAADVSDARSVDRLAAVRHAKDPLDLGRVVYTRPDGSERIALLSSVPLDENRTFGIARDITNEVALEARYRQSQKMEAIGRLAGGVAHDFNNLLVPIIGFADLALGRSSPDSELHGDLRDIKNAAERAADLTRQILAFGRRQVLELRIIDLNAVLATLQPMLTRLIRENISLEVSVDAELWPIRADRVQVEQILMNLAINAGEAMLDGGKLVIETANRRLDRDYFEGHGVEPRPGEYVLLAVSDSGHGMDAETRARIFEPFFTTKERGKGTGLGLATVFGIVKQHDGHIWVYSEPGQGTTFKVYLPAHRSAETPEPIAAPEAVPAGGAETLLVVEDDEMVRKLVCVALQAHGYAILEAAGPREGLEIAAQHAGDIDLLVTDVIMPDLNGRELYAQLVAMQPGLGVLYMSGYTANVIAHHGILDEDLDLLHKPFAIQDLLRAVRRVIDGSPSIGPG